MSELTKTNFADQAENVIKSLINLDRKGKPTLNLTTSKIRNLLSMTNALYNQAVQLRGEKLGEDILHDIQYLKMRFAYESGRENAVKEFVGKADIIKHLDSVGDSKEKLILFCNYMESLVAYHKFHGGRD